MSMTPKHESSMDAQTQKIKAAGLSESQVKMAKYPSYEQLYAELEGAADRMLALLLLERCERSAAVAQQVHGMVTTLARTYHDEKAPR